MGTVSGLAASLSTSQMTAPSRSERKRLSVFYSFIPSENILNYLEKEETNLNDSEWLQL